MTDSPTETADPVRGSKWAERDPEPTRSHTREAWCKSLSVPIHEGNYVMRNGSVVNVVRSTKGQFYARNGAGEYVRGLIYALRDDLEAVARAQRADA